MQTLNQTKNLHQRGGEFRKKIESLRKITISTSRIPIENKRNTTFTPRTSTNTDTFIHYFVRSGKEWMKVARSVLQKTQTHTQPVPPRQFTRAFTVVLEKRRRLHPRSRCRVVVVFVMLSLCRHFLRLFYLLLKKYTPLLCFYSASLGSLCI